MSPSRFPMPPTTGEDALCEQCVKSKGLFFNLFTNYSHVTCKWKRKHTEKHCREIQLHDLKVHSNYFANAVFDKVCIFFCCCFYLFTFSFHLPFIAVSLAGSRLRTKSVSEGFLRPHSRF